MAKRLSSLVAQIKSLKQQTYAFITDTHKQMQQGGLFNGFTKTYSPKEEGGDKLPSEQHKIQFKALDLVQKVRSKSIEYLDLSATIDQGNTLARASVEVDGKVILDNVPVSTLMFLEKQLGDWLTFLSKLPVLSNDEEWTFNDAQGVYMTPITTQHRTQKKTSFVVVAEATEHHPAQVKEVSQDLIVGFWSTIKSSAAIPPTKVEEWTGRTKKLLAAVKAAREEANAISVENVRVGANIFDYIFG